MCFQFEWRQISGCHLSSKNGGGNRLVPPPNSTALTLNSSKNSFRCIRISLHCFFFICCLLLFGLKKQKKNNFFHLDLASFYEFDHDTVELWNSITTGFNPVNSRRLNEIVSETDMINWTPRFNWNEILIWVGWSGVGGGVRGWHFPFVASGRDEHDKDDTRWGRIQPPWPFTLLFLDDSGQFRWLLASFDLSVSRADVITHSVRCYETFPSSC